jgi:hypothetical protein
MPAASPRHATAIGLLAVVCWSCTVGLMRSVAELFPYPSMCD